MIFDVFVAAAAVPVADYCLSIHIHPMCYTYSGLSVCVFKIKLIELKIEIIFLLIRYIGHWCITLLFVERFFNFFTIGFGKKLNLLLPCET